MEIRPFRNTDPPQLAQLWAAQPNGRGVARCVNQQLLETYVFSKPYFDREGLLVAERHGNLVGFVHAGFPCNEEQTDIDTQVGVTCLLMVAPQYAEDSVLRARLLAASESYLRGRGAKLIYGGSINPINPFYLGFYGGSELPGILCTDQVASAAFTEAGYDVVDRTVVMECDLVHFRAPVDRSQLQNRRKFRVDMETHPTRRSWWHACTQPPGDGAKFVVYPAEGGTSCGSVYFWIIEPMSSHYRRPTAGLTMLEVEPPYQRRGLAKYLNSEALRQLQIAGVSHVEVQTMQQNEPARNLYKQLGFELVDEGCVFRKPAPA